jgi:uncharacterized DUF497 family protein
MIDPGRLEGFEWDEGNSGKSAAKHHVSRAEAEQVFLNEPLMVAEDEKHSDEELRFHSFGHTDEGRRLHVTFTWRKQGTLIRVISARDMSRRERAIYEEQA